MKSRILFSKTNVLLLLVGLISGIFLSPKWSFLIMPWIHYAVVLRYFRDNGWKGFLLAVPVFAAASIIGNYQVFPMNFASLCIFMTVINIVGLLPFALEKFCYSKIKGWLGTLVFPIIYTIYIFILDQGPQGTWGNTAYTQYHFKGLIQIASITGIYGINFLVYWFASTINYWYENKRKKLSTPFWNFIMPIVFIISSCWGYYRLQSDSHKVKNVVVAAITIDNSDVMEEMYFAETGKVLKMPKETSQSDPILLEFQKGSNAFMADPDNIKFASVYLKMDELLEEYFEATKNAVEKGAKIITWSEAAITDIKVNENKTAAKVSSFVDSLDVYLFFPTAVFHPEKVGVESVFIENKVLTFGPQGDLLNTYFKNIPVMGIEPSFPGDGTIPIIKTEFGNLSPIICFDADFPNLISQISDSGTDLLVVPTGDWKAISPIHTYIAAFRCIENGVSMLKSTSHGLSAVVDDRGRILASYDYFDENEVKTLIHDMAISSSNTFYKKTGSIFILVLQILALIIIIFSILKYLTKRFTKKRGDN